MNGQRIPLGGSQASQGNGGQQGAQGEQGEQNGQGGEQGGEGGSEDGEGSEMAGNGDQAGGSGEDQDGSGGAGDAAAGSDGEGEAVASAGASGAGGVRDLFGTEESFGGGEGGSGGGSGGGDDAFGDSLEDFDRQMASEQEALARAGGGPAADDTLEAAAGTSSDGDFAGNGPGGQSGGSRPDEPDPRLNPNRTGAPAVQGCDDNDVVARQLCEVATRECARMEGAEVPSDSPFLCSDLWDEYNEWVAEIVQGR